MKIIGLDPSAQYHNKGLNGYCEAYGCWDIAEACKHHLEELWGGECRVVLSRENAHSLQGHRDYLSREIKALNDADCDIAVAIHTDAGGGRGITCFKGGAESERIGQALLDAFDEANLLPLRQDKPIYHYKGPTYLGVIRRTNMPTVLIECGFHDHPQDMQLIGSPAGRRAVGYALARGIADYYGWTVKQPWEVWRLPGSTPIECNVRVDNGIARADVRALCEGLGLEVDTMERKILVRNPENGGG